MRPTIRIAASPADLLVFLQATKDAASIALDPIGLSEQTQWNLVNGALTHVSGGFFHVVGVCNTQDDMEQHLMLYQPQSALTGLIIHHDAAGIHVLLQARVEPGNTNFVQYGPTVQSTPANYLKMHGGKATAYIEHFITYSKGVNLITHSIQHDLGKRYYQKSKTHHYLLTDAWLPTEEHMIWASLQHIAELIGHSEVLNADLRSLLAVFDWDGVFKMAPARPPMHERLHYIIAQVSAARKRTYRTIGLDALQGWEVDETGIGDKCGSGTSVQLFRFHSESREVTTWAQPLYCVAGKGLVQQMVRQEADGQLSFLITVGHEHGISTDHLILPSLVAYPEDRHEGMATYSGKVLRQMEQCDEGGRFFRNEVSYQLIEAPADVPLQDDQCWVSAATLQQLLSASNRCSIKMRCVASMALDLLHPASIGHA